MHKITDIYEYRNLSREQRDSFGRIRIVKREIRCKRDVLSASKSKRLLNMIIDFTLLYLLKLILLKLTPFEDYAFLVYVFVPFYFVLMEYYFQQTVGKILTKTLVINEYGNKPSLKQVILRTLIRAILYDAITFLVRDRGWHDTWTKTYVLEYDELDEIKSLLQDEDNLKP
jgi:uncharacterized RDD family membrane protein YckC